MGPPSSWHGRNAMGNWAFGDGHVKAMKAVQTVSSNPNFSMCDQGGPNTSPSGGSLDLMTQVTSY